MFCHSLASGPKNRAISSAMLIDIRSLSLVSAVEVDVLPGQRRDPFEDLSCSVTGCVLKCLQNLGQDDAVVVYDGIGDQANTLIPQVLLVLGPDTESTTVGVGYGSSQLMLSLATVQRLVDVAPKHRRVHVIEQIKALEDVIELPQCLLGAI